MMKGFAMMYFVHCLRCDRRISLGPIVELGLKLICPHCDAELEVMTHVPSDVDWPYQWRYEDEVRLSRRSIWFPRLWASLAAVARRCRFPKILPNANLAKGIPGADMRMEESEL
jgi:hypothetical protein